MTIYCSIKMGKGDQEIRGMSESQRQFVLSFLAYTVQRGLPAAQLCELSKLNLETLKNGSDWSYDFVMERLWTNASSLAGDELIGLHFGESLQLGALGVVGEIIQKSNTVGEALTIAASLTRMVTDQFIMEVNKKRQKFSVHFLPMANASTDSFGFRQMRDFLMVFTIQELDGLLLKKITPNSVFFPVHHGNEREYERVFRCLPKSRGENCILEFDMTLWSEPIITANYELQKALLEKMIAAQPNTLNHSDTMSSRVSSYLAANSYLGIRTLNEAAANFNMSARSLQRKLRQEGTSFHQVADTIRKSLAVHYIRFKGYPLKEVSFMLGYKETSAFSRAFKRWTGNSPGRYAS